MMAKTPAKPAKKAPFKAVAAVKKPAIMNQMAKMAKSGMNPNKAKRRSIGGKC